MTDRATYRANHRAALNAYARNYRATHKAVIAEKSRVYDAEHRDEIAARKREYHAEHKQIRVERELKLRYGMTYAEYEAMLVSQGGVCAICGGSPGKHRLHVDHDHKTGKVRALLCIKCNAALGATNDDIHHLFAMAMYLESHQLVKR